MSRQYRWSFLYPGWPTEKRAAFRAHYRAGGYRHLPLAPYGSYHQEPESTYDFSHDPKGFADIMNECWRAGVWPLVMCYTDPVGQSPLALKNAFAWAADYYPRVLAQTRIVGACLGWEFSGETDDVLLLRWAQHLRGIFGPSVLLYYHSTPERWSASPDRIAGDEDVTDDEVVWLRKAPIDGLLYQEPPDKPLDKVFHRCFDLPSPHGWKPGIKGRVEDGAGKDFVMFEFARDHARWQKVVAECQRRGVLGWC